MAILLKNLSAIQFISIYFPAIAGKKGEIKTAGDYLIKVLPYVFRIYLLIKRSFNKQVNNFLF